MSRWGTLNVPEGWKSLREELSPEKKEPSVTRLLLEDLRCQWASQGYSAHMMPLKPLSRFGPCESVPRGVWCVCAVCVCVCVLGGVQSVAQQKLQWSWADLGQTGRKQLEPAVSLNKPLIIQCHPLCKVGFRSHFISCHCFIFAFVFCKFLSVPQGTWNLGILAPQLGINPMPPSFEVWSLRHWTTREVPTVMSLLRGSVVQGARGSLPSQTPSASLGSASAPDCRAWSSPTLLLI